MIWILSWSPNTSMTGFKFWCHIKVTFEVTSVSLLNVLLFVGIFIPDCSEKTKVLVDCSDVMLMYFWEIKMSWALGICKSLQVYIWRNSGDSDFPPSNCWKPAETLNKHLTWRSVGFTRQQCANVAVLAGHDRDRHPSLVKHMKQDAAVLPSESCADPGVVNVDLHCCLAQLLTSQHVVDLHLQVKRRTWRIDNKHR